MTLGVLLCDHVCQELQPIGGDYPEMFSKLFADHAPEGIEVRLRFYDVIRGDYPDQLDECDGYLTTGSAVSVNDDEPWIEKLAEFVRFLHQQQAKLFAICFGHQMIAKALGGKVDISERGWGVGVHKVAVSKEEPWMDPSDGYYHVIGSHQEEITQLPPDSVVLASTAHCPVAMFRCGSLVGIQGHPEFGATYAKGLLRMRSEIIPQSTRDRAMESFSTDPSYGLLVSWILNYVDSPRLP